MTVEEEKEEDHEKKKASTAAFRDVTNTASSKVLQSHTSSPSPLCLSLHTPSSIAPVPSHLLIPQSFIIHALLAWTLTSFTIHALPHMDPRIVHHSCPPHLDPHTVHHSCPHFHPFPRTILLTCIQLLLCTDLASLPIHCIPIHIPPFHHTHAPLTAHVFMPRTPCIYALLKLFTHPAFMHTSTTQTHSSLVSCFINPHKICNIVTSQRFWRIYSTVMARSDKM